MRASRRRACSSDSSTRTPPPSPHTKPSRPTSNGREAFSGSSLRVDIAFIEQKPAMVSGTTMASAPPAIRVTNWYWPVAVLVWASDLVMGPIPDLPCVSADQNSSTVLPTGVSAPSPVTTTRRGSTILGVVLDVLDGVADGHDLLGVLVRDLDVEVLLQGHAELSGIEGVRAQVFDELRGRSDVVLLHPELLDDDLLHLILD